MQKLTQRTVDITKGPDRGKLIIRDSELKGFGLSVSSVSKSYIVDCRVNGIKRRVTVGRAELLSLDEGRAKARELLSKMTMGIDPNAEKRLEKVAVITLREILDVYLATKQLKPSTISVYRRQCFNAFPTWMDKPVVSLTKDMIEDRHREMSNGTRRNGYSGRAYANGCFTTLQALLNFAAEEYTVNGQPLIAVNPVSRLTKARLWHRVHPRTGVIPEAKIGAWYRAVRQLKNKTVSDYFLLLLFTGMRRNETLMLRWADINFQEKTLTVPRERSKTGQDHVLPLTEFVFDLLQERYLNRGGSPWIFPGRANKSHLTAFTPWLHEVREKSGCRFMVHDTRRSYLSAAERLECPYYVLKRLAGHKVSSDTLVPYIVVSMERLRAHAEKISRHFLDLIQEHAAAS
jgi:integrase